jgi:hypothetical protein
VAQSSASACFGHALTRKQIEKMAARGARIAYRKRRSAIAAHIRASNNLGQVCFGSRPCENVFYFPKLHTAGREPPGRDHLSMFLAVSTLKSIRAQRRAALSDLNGRTARTSGQAPHARIAARSGLIPTMFITRVRL